MANEGVWVLGAIGVLWLLQGRSPTPVASGAGFAGGGNLGGISDLLWTGEPSDFAAEATPGDTTPDAGGFFEPLAGEPSESLAANAVVAGPDTSIGGAPSGQLIEDVAPALIAYSPIPVSLSGNYEDGFVLRGDDLNFPSDQGLLVSGWGGPSAPVINIPGGLDVLRQSLIQHGPPVGQDQDQDQGGEVDVTETVTTDPVGEFEIDAAIAADSGFYEALDFEDLEFADE